MEQNNNFYNKNLRKFARINRKNPTDAEKYLWKNLLSGRQLSGYQFNRQRPIDKYVADFFCKELGLIIEVDGVTHENKQNEDEMRDKSLNSLGFVTFRFTDDEVMGGIQNVEEILKKWILDFEGRNPVVLSAKGRKRRGVP